MKDPADNQTGELIESPKPKRGRPPTGTAMTSAERKARYRQGKRSITIDLDEDTYHALANYLERNQIGQKQAIEKLLRTQLLRKR